MSSIGRGYRCIHFLQQALLSGGMVPKERNRLLGNAVALHSTCSRTILDSRAIAGPALLQRRKINTKSTGGKSNNQAKPQLRETPKDRFFRQREERRAKSLHGFYEPHETDDAIEMDGDSVKRREPEPRFKTESLSTDVIVFLHKRYDFTWRGIKIWAQEKRWLFAEMDQEFKARRHGVVGPDLATAHFVTFRKGRVQFYGSDTWWTDDEKLPMKYDERFRIKSVAVGDQLDLVYQGLDNLTNLRYLENLDLSGSKRLNDFCFDKLYRTFRKSHSLRHLNVSNCPGFSERSLAAVYRIPSLKKVTITGTPAADYGHFELLEHLLQDINPFIEIERGEPLKAVPNLPEKSSSTDENGSCKEAKKEETST